MARKFKPGTPVRLITGTGPIMAVIKDNDNSEPGKTVRDVSVPTSVGLSNQDRDLHDIPCSRHRMVLCSVLI